MTVLHGRQPGQVRPRAGLGRIAAVLDNALTIKPRRQMWCSSQAASRPRRTSLDAIRYAGLGCTSVQAATNGIEFARRPDFAREAAEAGLRHAYLRFDGIGNAAKAHRHVGNLTHSLRLDPNAIRARRPAADARAPAGDPDGPRRAPDRPRRQPADGRRRPDGPVVPAGRAQRAGRT
ncbi:MAG: hypothetical protein R2708_20995 [Vicinamibacterales bacterium]